MKHTALAILALLVALPTAALATEPDAEATTSKEATPRLTLSPKEAPLPLMAKKQNTSFLVGQIYAGGHAGFAVPTSIGRSDDEISFKDVAKTGFVIYGDMMWQMNQAIGLGGEIGYRRYGYNDKKTWGNLTRYGTFDATFQTIDFDLTGRVFIGRQSIRPFVGILIGGEVLMNDVDFAPSTQYQGSVPATVYETRNLSVMYGLMAGAYFKAGRRTLLSVQARLNFVPTVDDGTIEITQPNGDLQTIFQNTHGNQTNISVTFGLHIGTQKNNKH